MYVRLNASFYLIIKIFKTLDDVYTCAYAQ